MSQKSSYTQDICNLLIFAGCKKVAFHKHLYFDKSDNYKYAICKERKCLRELGNQHSEDTTSVELKKINCTGGIMRDFWWK